MPIAATRGLLHAALAGELERAEFRTDTLFGFEVPIEVPAVEPGLLDPRSTWSDPEAYDRQARRLAQMFRDNFSQFEAAAGAEITAAGPRV
jgi:phosphoenolpyruvate carboxykinase (ATP)